jgi:hypothetical protein
MRGRRATSRGQAKSGRAVGASGSPSSWCEGDDYPVDETTPDDLPVRDVREDQEEWRSPDSAGCEGLGEHSQGLADAAEVHPGSLEVRGTPSQDPIPHTVHHHPPTPEPPTPEQPVETASAEPPAQNLLSGLEPDASSGQGHTPQRITRARRPGTSADKRALRAAQIELWPQADSFGSQT